SVFTLSFFSHPPPSPEFYTLSLHDALPIFGPSGMRRPDRLRQERPARFPQGRFAARRGGRRRGRAARRACRAPCARFAARSSRRSEEHTSELQSRFDLVCRLLLEKKKK